MLLRNAVYDFVIKKVTTALDRALFRQAMRNMWFSRGPRNFLSVSPPTRPSPADIRNYDAALRSAGDRSDDGVLILGATPELRVLMANRPGSIYIADFSNRMVAATKKAVPEEVRRREHIILSDWLDLKPPDTSGYGAVIGDSVIKQIHFSERERFVAVISSLLRSGGHFLTRIRLRSPKWATVPIRDILKEGAMLETAHVPGADRVTLFRMYDALADNATGTVFLRAHADAIRRAVKELPPEMRNTAVIRAVLTQCSFRVRWSHLFREELERIMHPYFRIAGEYWADDYEDADAFPLILFQKHA